MAAHSGGSSSLEPVAARVRLHRPAWLASLAVALPLAACGLHPADPASALGGEPRLRLAQAAEESGDAGLAEEMYAAAAAAAPTDATVQLRYADVLVRRGRIAQARALLTKHLNTVSDPQQLRAGLASLYVLTGEPARAIAEFDAVLTANPNDIRAVVDKAVALDMMGRHEEAQGLYRQALASAPGDPVVINDLALSMLLAGRAREAQEVAAPLRSQTDVSPRIRTGMGVVLAANGDLAGAREMAGTAVADDQLLGLARAAKTASSP
jgi:Flp pilus assembly protein TadD